MTDDKNLESNMKNKEDIKKNLNDFALNFHKEAGDEFSYSRNIFISFFVSIVSSIGMFGYGFNFALKKNYISELYFLILTFFSILILSFIYYIANIFSFYSKRGQLLMSSAECRLDKNNIVIPKSLNVFKSKYNEVDPIAEPPELLKIFKVFILIIEFSIFIFYIFFEKCIKQIFMLNFLFLFLVIVLNFLLNCFFRWKNYNKRLNKLRDELNFNNIMNP